MDKTVFICFIIMAVLTAIVGAIILVDYIRIRKGKPSFLWNGKNGTTYSIVHKVNGYKLTYATGLTLEEAKKLQQELTFCATIEKEE